MKYRLICAVGLLSVLVFTGCQKQEKSDNQSTPKPEISAGEVKKKVEDAVESTKEYVLQQSEEYRKDLEKKLEEIDEQLEEWRPKIEELEAAAREKFQKELEESGKETQACRRQVRRITRTDQTSLEGSEGWDGQGGRGNGRRSQKRDRSVSKR